MASHPPFRTLAFFLLLALGGLGCVRTTQVHCPRRHFTPSMPVVVSDHMVPPTQALPNVGLLKRAIIRYHDSGAWEAEIAAIAADAMTCFDADSGTIERRAIVLDIDETCLSNWDYLLAADFSREPNGFAEWMKQAKGTPIGPMLELYRRAIEKKVAVFFITGRKENLREATEKNLTAAGFGKWHALLMKPADYAQASVVPFKAGQRKKIADQGFRILLNVGDQDSDLAGGFAERAVKLPNPAYYIP